MRRTDTIRRELDRLNKRFLDRVHRGRTRGAGAGGYVRDLDNIRHLIRLAERDLAQNEAVQVAKTGIGGNNYGSMMPTSSKKIGGPAIETVLNPHIPHKPDIFLSRLLDTIDGKQPTISDQAEARKDLDEYAKQYLANFQPVFPSPKV